MFNITLTGKMEIPHKLDEDKDISFVCKRAGLRNITRKPVSVDGQEEDITYKFQNLDEVTVIQEDKIMFGKPRKGSQSQKFRMVCNDVYNQQYSGGDEYKTAEDYYNKRMSDIIQEEVNKLV